VLLPPRVRRNSTIVHDLYLSTVIFNALSTLVLIGVCSVLAVHDPLRRRTARRYSVISRFP